MVKKGKGRVELGMDNHQDHQFLKLKVFQSTKLLILSSSRPQGGPNTLSRLDVENVHGSAGTTPKDQAAKFEHNYRLV